MRRVFIAGVGSTVFGRHLEIGIEALGIRACELAIRDAGVDRDRLGALYLGNFVSGPLLGREVLAGIVADGLGLGAIPCTKVEGACASGGMAFRHAYLSVATGQCEAALAVGVEKMTQADTTQVTSALNCAMDHDQDALAGLTFPGVFGLACQAYMDRYDLRRDQLSQVVRKNKFNGLANPLAQMGDDLQIDQISGARLISDPLRLFDCCPASDGGTAALLVSEEFLPSIKHPVEVIGSAQTRGNSTIGGQRDLCSFSATIAAADAAFAQAGITPDEVDFTELHDCFSIAEIIDSEDLGLVPRGMGGHFAAEGRTSANGDIPINPSGGLLAKGHPVGATGLGQIYESVQQLRGQHPNQVQGAMVAMTHNLGGTGVACTVNILRMHGA